MVDEGRAYRRVSRYTSHPPIRSVAEGGRGSSDLGISGSRVWRVRGIGVSELGSRDFGVVPVYLGNRTWRAQTWDFGAQIVSDLSLSLSLSPGE